LEVLFVKYSDISRESILKIMVGKGSGARGQKSPVKFASLLFFEKFNGASRDQGFK
jgi:hypothetical protein